MKIAIIILMIIGILNGANIEVKQNMKALYKGIELTDVQEEYILDNQDYNIEIVQKALKKDIEKFKSKYIDEKNIISFTLTPDGKASNIKFLQKSKDRNIDKMTKKSINEISNKFAKPQEETEIRFIISYRAGQSQEKTNYSNQRESVSNNKEPYYQNISRGTTRFQHDSKEYVRFFETSKDGYINLSVNPQLCMDRATILTEKGQRVAMVGLYNMLINKEILKGKYKLLLKTNATCDVNLEYQ